MMFIQLFFFFFFLGKLSKFNRGGPSNGNMGSAKMDGNLQLNGGNSRVTSRNDMDIGSLLRERKECTVGQEKERIITKGSNK